MAETAKPATATATQTKAKTDPTTEDLARQVDALKGDIARLTESLGDFGRAKGRQYRTEAQRRAEGLRRDAEGRASALRHDAEERYDEVERYVQDNPATALGIAAAIGLLIGLLTRR